MRVLYVVDVHGRFDAVVDAVERAGPVDVLLVGGDLTNAGSPKEAQGAIELWRPLAPTLLAVAGNMDSPAIDARLVDLGVSLDGRSAVLEDVGFAGASAAPPTTLNTPHELSDDEFARRAAMGLADIADCRVRILCPHAPPHGTGCDMLRTGAHVGSRALRVLIEREQPDVVLCGHIHESRCEDRIGRARIVNPGPVVSGHYAVVEIGETVAVMLDPGLQHSARTLEQGGDAWRRPR